MIVIMEQSKRHIGIYLIIAFSIAWVSVASILNFHMNKIYGEDILGQIEYLKTDQNNTIKKDGGLSYKIDYNNNGVAICCEKENDLNIFNKYVVLSTQINKGISQDCYLTPVLRGPPSIS